MAVVWGPIEFDAAGGPATVNNGTLITPWNHTVSGMDRILIVGVSYRDLGQSVSSITYNGIALTRIATANNAGQVTVETGDFLAPRPAERIRLE